MPDRPWWPQSPADMSELLALTPAATAVFWHGYFVFLRAGAMLSLLPAFGERSVPMRVKLGLALMFTLIVAPAAPHLAVPETPADLLWISMTETLTGSVIGIGLRLLVLALQTAGSIAAQSTSLAQMVGGTVEPVPAMGYVLLVTGLALAVTLGLHIKAAHLLLATYRLFPPGVLPDPTALADWGVRQVASAFRLAFSLAVPFVVASFIYNLTLGVINRAMPQLMVAFVGAPFTTLGGLVLLLLATPIMLTHWLGALDTFLANPIGAPK